MVAWPPPLALCHETNNQADSTPRGLEDMQSEEMDTLSERGSTAFTEEVLPESPPEANNDLESLLKRVNHLAKNGSSSPGSQAATPAPTGRRVSAKDSKSEDTDRPWQPQEPATLAEAGISEGQLEHLALRSLAALGELSGHQIAEQHSIPFRLIEPILADLKYAQMVAYRGSASMNDYIYQLTDHGRETARKLTEICSYLGSAPVTLKAYVESVAKQTLTQLHPTVTDLQGAFSDLLVNPRMLRRLGPAVNSGRGLFLYGAPGNGKTSIAERITKAFGDTIWIPRAIGIDGEVMRVFDPGLHEEVPLKESEGILLAHAIDKRWVRIRRPTIVVGGELTMDALDVIPSSGNNVSEAPLQMKSNCGTLVIDDFGRQRMTTDELLNRWIVPLEKRYDFLRMVNGKKIQVPFDQLIIFSTNLEPKDLVDDAFLRRIPYKIEVPDPSEDEFRKLFEIMAPIVGLDFNQEALDYLVNEHYKPVGRPYRCCQPRDLLLQIRNYCHYLDVPPQMCKEYFDYAVENYFAIM